MKIKDNQKNQISDNNQIKDDINEKKEQEIIKEIKE